MSAYHYGLKDLAIICEIVIKCAVVNGCIRLIFLVHSQSEIASFHRNGIFLRFITQIECDSSFNVQYSRALPCNIWRFDFHMKEALFPVILRGYPNPSAPQLYVHNNESLELIRMSLAAIRLFTVARCSAILPKIAIFYSTSDGFPTLIAASPALTINN